MNATLTPQQQAVATRIYADGVRGGLPPARAKELALAALHESGLRADAQGPPVASYGGKRAGGVLQLLSPGYVQRANQHGGVFNIDANVGAILPDYANYWRSHPNAPIGEAAAAVERSGQGADYYGAGADQLSFLGGAPGSTGPAPSMVTGGPSAPGAPQGNARRDFALAIAQNIGSHKGLGGVDLGGLLQNLHAGLQAEGDPATAAAGPMPTADTTGIVKTALSQLGTPYQWGGAAKLGSKTDCSGLLQATMAAHGIQIPRTTYDQWKVGQPVDASHLQPGDAVFFDMGKQGPNHVGIYIGGGRMIEDPHTGATVRLADMKGRGFVGARRYVQAAPASSHTFPLAGKGKLASTWGS